MDMDAADRDPLVTMRDRIAAVAAQDSVIFLGLLKGLRINLPLALGLAFGIEEQQSWGKNLLHEIAGRPPVRSTARVSSIAETRTTLPDW